MWLYLVIGIVSLCAWLQFRWRRMKSYWAERNVPHQPPHPLLGSLTFLQKENPAIWLRRIFRTFQSPYVGIWLFWKPALVINSPEIARNILVRDADIFRNRYISSGTNDPIGGLNLFTVNDPTWSSVRRRLTSVFTSAKLKMFQHIPQSKSKHLVDKLIADTDKGKEIDLRDVFADFSTDVIGETAFGMRSDSILTGQSPLRDITREFMKFNKFRGLAWSSIFFLPQVVNIFGFSLFPKSTVKYLTKIFKVMVQQRGGYEKPVTEIRDLFDALLKIKQESVKEGESIAEDLLIAQAAIFLQGGFDTTAGLLTYCIYEMAFHPYTQDKLYQELIQAKECTENNKLDAQVLGELPYLNAVLKESLRKYPAMGWLDRVAAKDYQIDEYLTIPAGTVVYVNAIGMQSSPEYFPEPEKFEPDRFMPENEHLLKPYTYMPFGTGPRHCIGERFANQSLRFAVSTLLLNFKFHVILGKPLPNETAIEKKGLFLMPGEKLSVNFIKREK